MRLTDDILRKHPRPKAGQKLVWDDLVSGFGVRFTPTVAAFVVQWRESSGRKVRDTLARWPACTVESAREKARHRLSEAVSTTSSGADIQLRRAMRTWFELQTTRAEWRPRYRSKVDSIIATYVEGVPSARVKLTPGARKAIDELGLRPVAGVTRSDILRVADQIKRGAADQFMAILSSYFNHAFERELVLGNPARNRLKITGGRRIRRTTPTNEQFMALWRAFEKEGDPALGAFALLALTGARRREVTEMQWCEVDLAAQTWTLPAARRKTGKKDPEPFTINLHPMAVQILKRQPMLEGSPFVFWGRRDKSAFDFQHAQMDRIRDAVESKDWRLHDLRRFVRTGMASLGVSQMVAEMCLGHLTAKGGLVGVYDRHAYTDEKRAAWMKWGDHVQQVTGAR